MATVQCSKCTVERKGFRRELDSWRHKLIHCVGFESILQGIYGQMLLSDLNLFDDCEPEEIDDWSPEASCSQCSFCNLPLDKLSDQAPAATSPLSSPSDYSPGQAPTISESSQSAHRFLQAVFHKKDVPPGCDFNIPLVAQELMKKMIHQFALEYASKCLLHTSTNGVTTRTSSPLSETSDAPLDLTVSRTQEEKEGESEPDGALDLSNRNSACSATSSTSSKASGSLLPSVKEELGDLGQRGTKCLQMSALDAVLSSLCPSHSSLLYQILKLAHQEKMLFLSHRPVGQLESECCHCGSKTQSNVPPNAVIFNECKAHNSCLCFSLTDCDHQGHERTMYHPGDCKSSCSIHQYPLTNCKSEAPQHSSYCCLQRSRVETYTARCPKRLHCTSCQDQAIGNTNNAVCSFASSLSSSKSPSVCPPSSSLCPCLSICCEQHNPHSCYSNYACPSQVTTTIERDVGDEDLPCPVLKREQSPSPPPLSPMPSDINKKTDEKPPSLLHHRQENEADLIVKDGLVTTNQVADMDTTPEDEQAHKTPKSSQTEQAPSGTSLQDVVNRFSEKLETIKPMEKGTSLVSTSIHVSEKEPPQSLSNAQNLEFHADSHLTEIITTVLHTGRASDYNLSELFNRHDNKGPKSPNTRSRRRQEVLAAMATPANNASSRRHSLQIKRELAMFDQSYRRKKMLPAKRAKLKDDITTSSTSSDSNLVKGEPEREIKLGMELEPETNNRGEQETLSILTTGSNGVLITEERQIIKAEENEEEISSEGKDLPFFLSGKQGCDNKCDSLQTHMMTATTTSAKQCGGSSNEDGLGSSPGPGKDFPKRERQKCPSQHSKDERRSRRNIVPPQRFSSYVTEPRKMFFVACFSENIFNQKTQKDKEFTSSTLDALSHDLDAEDIQFESLNESPLSSHDHTETCAFQSTHTEQCGLSSVEESNGLSTNQVYSQDVTAKEKSPTKHSSDNGEDGSDCDGKPCGRVWSSSKRLLDSKTTSSTPKNISNKDVTSQSATIFESPPIPQVHYTSPIKLMFVSPVKDKEGVRYSLKSAGSVLSGQAEEHFDPCEESSWSGTLQKKQCTETATSEVKSVSSPSQSSSSPSKSISPTCKPASSPSKSFSPAKSSSSPKSASSSPKLSSRRSHESTPTKRVAGTESQRSPGDLLYFHETTPPKRRPGRPKKLGPQLEQKVKRPIGRPRKQKALDSVIGVNRVNAKSDMPSDVDENVNKNLKITVVYGRSRRNKRMVSEGFDQLQTEFHDAWQAVGLKSDLGILMHNSEVSSGSIKSAPTELAEELDFVNPVKESSTPQASRNLKCQKQDDSVPSRKPGRPAKVKISGISVTVTTVSPRQRKIQINKDTLPRSSETIIHKKVLSPELKSAKEPLTITRQSTGKISLTEKGIETKDQNRDKLPNRPVAVRHSMRVRKPSIHFLHAVATSTSRSYSHSNALLRRSKQLLLNKASNERRQAEQQTSVETSGEKRQFCRRERKISQDLSRVAGVSVGPIFTPKETLRWWAVSTEEKTMNQELARRIRLISDTWVSDPVETQEREIAFNTKQGTKGNRKFKHSSVVQALFDCPPDKPRSCSMQQLCSWFMQSTETQSLAIVKKASSRNPYEDMHFPRSTNKQSFCQSPQAERLRKHIKKFAKMVPKSPQQHQQAQRRLNSRNQACVSTHIFRRRLFTPRFAAVKHRLGAQCRRSKAFGKYQATLFRARKRFLNQKGRERWQKRLNNKEDIKPTTACSNGHVGVGLQPKHKALRRSVKHQLSDRSGTNSVDQTQESLDVPKEQNLCSKAWSPETLKECRVFLRKINSPDNESTEEECDSCTVTLDDGSPSAYHFAGRERQLLGLKTVKTERKRSLTRTVSREPAGSTPKSVQKQDEMPVERQKGKHKSSGVVSTEPAHPPPAKMLRQSRMRGLTGPRWCDFVFETK